MLYNMRSCVSDLHLIGSLIPFKPVLANNVLITDTDLQGGPSLEGFVISFTIFSISFVVSLKKRLYPKIPPRLPSVIPSVLLLMLL